MSRYRLTLEYDGAPFHGWQSQPSGMGVQDHLTRALMQFCGEKVVVYGAGRTDSGVHARGQVAHIDLATPHSPHQIRDAMNFHLRPQPIVILDAVMVAPDFDARFSALARYYRYQIIIRAAPLALDHARAWQIRSPLDVTAMARAAKCLIGRHDFTTFRAAQCQARSPIKTLDQLDIVENDKGIMITARARSFLQHQVRSLVGALQYVGSGKWSENNLRDALVACDRTACAQVAPAHGLYLMRVDYPEK